MRTIKYLLAALAAGSFAFFSQAGVVHAAYTWTASTTGTYIGGTLEEDRTLTATGSPYFLTEDLIVQNHKLTIEPGVFVISDGLLSHSISLLNAQLMSVGEKGLHIRFSGIKSIFASSSDVIARYAEFSTRGSAFDARGASLDISSSTFSGIGVSAISILGGKTMINSSIFENNRYAIYANPDGGDVGQIDIHGSSLKNNFAYAIYSSGPTVNATNNWWGSGSGPVLDSENGFYGPVQTLPFLQSEPEFDRDMHLCCSSVVFLPGIEASRLYLPTSNLIFGSGSNQLWEPNRNADAQKLLLNKDGSSVNQNVYSGKPIDSVLGIFDIYGKFMNKLDSLVKDGTINEWRPFGYDWRKSIPDVVTGVERKGDSTESLIQTVEDVARRSQTGKVTLIAHSNGGLVAKYLVKTLQDLGKAGLIDSVISVAVPFIGTPQAILGLLHGGDQSIAYGLIVKESVARSLAENMSSAYSLLPSAEYFKRLIGPTIAFASTTMEGMNNGTFPQTVDTYSAQKDFITNTKNGRLNASTSDTSLAIKGNSALLNAADTVHAVLDPFVWPVSIGRLAIAGWNKLTTGGVDYKYKDKCLLSLLRIACKPSIVHEKSLTSAGDGTVVTASAIADTDNVLLADLKKLSSDEGKDYDHSNILESGAVEDVIGQYLGGRLQTRLHGSVYSVSSDLSVLTPSFVTPEGKYLIVSTHSPVDLNIYDSAGRHTGPISLPEGADEVYSAFETAIPGSDYYIGGQDEEGKDSYIVLPDNGEKYSVTVNGTGVGAFTLDVEEKVGDETIDAVGFGGQSVTPLTVATTVINDPSFSRDNVEGLSALVRDLSIDVDGDGSIDVIASTSSAFDPVKFLENIRSTVLSLAGKSQKGTKLSNRILKLEELIKADKLKKAHKVANKLPRKIAHMRFKALSETDKQQILDMIDEFLQQFE